MTLAGNRAIRELLLHILSVSAEARTSGSLTKQVQAERHSSLQPFSAHLGVGGGCLLCCFWAKRLGVDLGENSLKKNAMRNNQYVNVAVPG